MNIFCQGMYFVFNIFHNIKYMLLDQISQVGLSGSVLFFFMNGSFTSAQPKNPITQVQLNFSMADLRQGHF